MPDVPSVDKQLKERIKVNIDVLELTTLPFILGLISLYTIASMPGSISVYIVISFVFICAFVLSIIETMLIYEIFDAKKQIRVNHKLKKLKE